MTSSQSVRAEAVNTFEWLAAPGTTISVPVYQRQYRWGVDSCAELLADIRRVAGGDDPQTHFIGSILSTTSTSGGVTEIALIDGQQRVSTLFLLIAALRETVKRSDPTLAEELQRVLVHPTDPTRTRLRPHDRRASVLESLVFSRSLSTLDLEASRFDDNYEFFLTEIEHDAARVWAGLQHLEHVAITLGEHANPQQIFESLNSTGTPLKNGELIHNYTLMGLTHDQQAVIEQEYWAPIEENTGDSLEAFLRDYLILKTGRDLSPAGEHGIYTAFKAQFPRLGFGELKRLGAEWRAHSEVYAILLDPLRAGDAGLAQQVRYVSTFGSAMYPLLMGVYRAFLDQVSGIGRDELLEAMERLQSLYVRKAVVGESRDRLIAQLCRRWTKSGYPIRALLSRAPTDERIRSALTSARLPYAGYVLGRLLGVGDLTDLQIEHIFPQTPLPTWSGDGNRTWANLTAAEQAQFMQLLPTLGNLTLLEGPLNAGASNRPFPEKRAYYYQSDVCSTLELADVAVWDTAAIEARTVELTNAFLTIWRRPGGMDPEPAEQLVPILDALKKTGHYPGWRTEFDYVRFHDEIWETRNIKDLYSRVYQRLWETRRPAVLAFDECNVKAGPAAGRRLVPIDESHYLYAGWDPQYLLTNIQALLDQLDLADGVLIKYATGDE